MKIYFYDQEVPDKIDVFSDSDWAGCSKTRKSTSGGCIMFGTHLLHHWSSTQATIALSSAEAELNAIVKACSEGLGFQNVLCEFNLEVPIQIGTDSSAAKGIACRRGAGKVKHLETRQLWVQDLVYNTRVQIEKIPRTINPADLFTHHWLKVDGVTHLTKMSVKR